MAMGGGYMWWWLGVGKKGVDSVAIAAEDARKRVGQGRKNVFKTLRVGIILVLNISIFLNL
jgi:hypothetical protein